VFDQPLTYRSPEKPDATGHDGYLVREVEQIGHGT
jgi:hypothetical protein